MTAETNHESIIKSLARLETIGEQIMKRQDSLDSNQRELDKKVELSMKELDRALDARLRAFDAATQTQINEIRQGFQAQINELKKVSHDQFHTHDEEIQELKNWRTGLTWAFGIVATLFAGAIGMLNAGWKLLR